MSNDHQSVYRLWFERAFPERYASLLAGISATAESSSDTPDAPLAALPRADAIIASAKLQYDGALMDRAPNLRVISRTGIGTDNISIADATARGIVVCNAPAATTVSTAEMTITLLLAVARDLKGLGRALERGQKRDFFNTYRGMEVQGLLLGLVGLGRIGTQVARMAQSLGMLVMAYDPYLAKDRVVASGIELAPDLESLLRSADVVSLHIPSTAETRHLMNAARLAEMKAGAILINTARGMLVDERALLESLESGHLRGAGLDVLQKEPPQPDHPLLNRDDVIITPHIAAATEAGRDRLWKTAIAQALQVLRDERPPDIVNPEVWSTRKSVGPMPNGDGGEAAGL